MGFLTHISDRCSGHVGDNLAHLLEVSIQWFTGASVQHVIQLSQRQVGAQNNGRVKLKSLVRFRTVWLHFIQMQVVKITLPQKEDFSIFCKRWRLWVGSQIK